MEMEAKRTVQLGKSWVAGNIMPIEIGYTFGWIGSTVIFLFLFLSLFFLKFKISL